jgi:DNA-binding beta-propeller fold protein YncE
MYPSGVEFDPTSGAIVVADTGNNLVTKYSAGGALLWSVGGYGTTTSPLRFINPRDVGVDASGDVYVADTSNVRIVKLDGDDGSFVSSWRGPPTDKIGTPMGVTVSLYDGLVYVADASKRKVRVFGQTGTQQDAFAEDPACPFSAIRDADAGPGGTIYVANYLKNNVVMLDPTGDCVGSWGSKGTGNGQFKNPYGVRVAFDPALGDEAVFVADSNNNRVQEFTTEGAFVAKFGSTGTGDANFDGMRRVAVGPAGGCGASCIRVAGADMWGWKIGIWESDGSGGYAFAQRVPDPAEPPPGEGGTSLTDPVTSVFNEARAVAFGADGELRVVDTVNNRIVWFDRLGNLPSGAGTWDTCGERGSTLRSFNWPRGLAVDVATGDLWVADTKQSRLQVIPATCTGGAFVGSMGSGAANFNWPYSVAIRQSDRVAFVADTKNNRVKAYDVATRTVLDVFGTKGAGTGQFNLPSGIAVDEGTGRVFVADRNNKRIVELTFDGSSFGWAGTYTAGGTLDKPEGVAAADGLLYVADTNDGQLVILHLAGGGVHATLGGFDLPQSVSVDLEPGGAPCIFLSDTYADTVRVYTYGGACS